GLVDEDGTVIDHIAANRAGGTRKCHRAAIVHGGGPAHGRAVTRHRRAAFHGDAVGIGLRPLNGGGARVRRQGFEVLGGTHSSAGEVHRVAAVTPVDGAGDG